MSETRLRIGMIGAGLITSGSHLPAALGSPRATVTAIVDPVVQRADHLARSYGISPTLSSDLEAALDAFDAAVISTPNDTHAPLAITCLQAGKDVLIEKPMATSVEEGEAILEAARETDRIVAVGYSTRFRESVVLLKDLLSSRQFGEVRRFVNRFGTAGGWSPLSAYNLRKGTSGGGVLVVSGTHFLDRMLYLWGYPSTSQLYTDATTAPEANCRAIFGFERPEGELTGMAVYSKTAGMPSGTVIDTEAGYVMLGEFDDSELLLRPHDNPRIEHVIRRKSDLEFPPDSDSFDLQMDDFVAACLDRRSPRVDGHQGLASLRLLEELYRDSQPLSTDWYSESEEESQ